MRKNTVLIFVSQGVELRARLNICERPTVPTIGGMAGKHIGANLVVCTRHEEVYDGVPDDEVVGEFTTAPGSKLNTLTA